MKAAVFYKPNEPFVIEEVPMPEVGKHDVLVKIAACGICGSDLHFWKGVPTVKKPPLILGHEISGIVEEVGEAVTRVKKGDRVIIPSFISCGECLNCKSGRENICEKWQMIGNYRDGGYAEYISVPERSPFVLPPEIPLEESCIISCCVMTAYGGIVERAKVRVGEKIAVFGCGGVGLAAVQIANICGADVIAIDISDEKLELAKKFGAQHVINSSEEDPVKSLRAITAGRGVDVAVDFVGSAQVLTQAIRAVRFGGRVILLGITTEKFPLDVVASIVKGLDILGSSVASISSLPRIMELVKSGKLRLNELITRKLRLEEINEGFEALSQGKVLGRQIVVM